jgi:hypothetical protein
MALWRSPLAATGARQRDKGANMMGRVLATALTGLVSPLGLSSSRAGDISNDGVVSLIRSEVGRRSAHINLARLGADWDGVRVIGPYTPTAKLPPMFARDPGVIRSRIDRRDDITILAFWRGAQVASVVQVPRAVLDLSPVSDQRVQRGQCIMINADGAPRATAIAECP